MPQASSLHPSERLPWLSDPARPQPRQSRRSSFPLILALSAAGAIAFGGWALVERTSAPAPPAAPLETVPLPAPQSTSPVADAQPQSPSVSEREALRPQVAERSVAPASTIRPKRRTETVARARTAAGRKPAARAAAPRGNSAAPAYNAGAWKSGVRGRIIQVGAYRTSADAQAQWKRVYYRYPLLRPLPPRVIKSKVRGRTYYRLQLGTFSQAHSELLCQRLRTLGEGCMVLGLRRNRR